MSLPTPTCVVTAGASMFADALVAAGRRRLRGPLAAAARAIPARWQR